MSGILAEEAHVVRVKTAKVAETSVQEAQTEIVPMPVQSAAAEASESESRETEDGSPSRQMSTSEEVLVQPTEVGTPQEAEEEIGLQEEKILVDGQILELVEEEGGACAGRAEPEGVVDLPVETIREGMPRDAMAEETKADKSLQSIYKLAELDREGYHLQYGLIFQTRLNMFGKPVEQLCVPTSHRQKCLQAAHTSFGHQGRNKMILLLRPHFYWPCMARDCVSYVRGCIQCQQADKSTPKPARMIERPIVTQPFSDVAVDIVGPFPTAVGGYRFMLTCIDSASRWPEALPIRTTTSRVVTSCLESIFTRWGFPEELTSDNGSQFVSLTFKKWLRDKGIAHSRSTPYHPQGNGVVERLHRTLNAVVSKTVESKGNWAKVLPMALYFLRCTPSASTGVSPFLLTHGWEARTPLQLLYQSWVKSDLGRVDLSQWILENSDRLETVRDVATSNLVEASAKRAQCQNKKAKHREVSVGDSVWVRRPGLPEVKRELDGTREGFETEQPRVL